MSKSHIVFLTEAEIKANIKHCKAGIKMAEDSPFFAAYVAELKTTLAKLEEKAREFNWT